MNQNFGMRVSESGKRTRVEAELSRSTPVGVFVLSAVVPIPSSVSELKGFFICSKLEVERSISFTHRQSEVRKSF